MRTRQPGEIAAIEPPGDPAAAAARLFPRYPASWYLFGAAGELRNRPVSKDLLGTRLVAFDTGKGGRAIMEARCAHLGADLGRGCVVAGRLQCPFHHWEYGADGRCAHAPGRGSIPDFARQRVYPVEERHGFLFVFNGSEPLFPLPFFSDIDPGALVAGRPFQFTADCSWYMLASNGFDFDHFNAVHDRRLVGSPAIDAPHPFARRTRFAAEVAGGSIFDRLIRAFAGDAVEVSITNWGGTLIFVTGRFRRAGSYMLISSRPTAAHETRVEVIVFAPRDGWPGRAGLQALNLWIRRTFTRAFFSDDIARLSGIRYHPEGLTGGDQDLIDYFNWAATLHGRGAGQARKGPW